MYVFCLGARLVRAVQAGRRASRPAFLAFNERTLCVYTSSPQWKRPPTAEAHNVVQPPRSNYSATVSICLRSAEAMPPAYNVDIKLSFPQFDMTPGSEGHKFRRNLLLHGGKADSHGFSLADCLLRLDAHAVQRGQPIAMPPPAGTLAAPGAPAAPAAGAMLVMSRQLRRARLKESFRYLKLLRYLNSKFPGAIGGAMLDLQDLLVDKLCRQDYTLVADVLHLSVFERAAAERSRDRLLFFVGFNLHVLKAKAAERYDGEASEQPHTQQKSQTGLLTWPTATTSFSLRGRSAARIPKRSWADADRDEPGAASEGVSVKPRGRAPGSEPKKLPGGSARKTLSSITAEEEANMPELHMALQAAAARQ